MKRVIIPLLSIILCLACSRQEKEVTVTSDELVFYASVERPCNLDSKVYADEDLMVLWHADDRISIFNQNTYNQEYRFTGETGDNAGYFKMVSGDEFVMGNTLSGIWAVYPYQETTKIGNEGELTFQLPSEQAYVPGNFGRGANIMVSATTGNNLLFRNAGGYLVLKFYGDGVSISSISIKGNNGELLAGEATISMPINGVPCIEMLPGESTEELMVTCATPVTLDSSAEDYTEFWFVLPPTTFSEGFTVTVTGSNGGTFEKSTTKNITIARNMITHMAPFEVTFSDGSVPPNNEIWYTSTNGEVVTPYNKDGFGATLVSNTYSDGKGVMTFDGSVTKLERNIFHYCTTLKTIQIPNSVTEIGDWAFNYCFGLESFVVPESVTSLGQGCFSSCRNLISLSGKYASEDQRSLMVDQTLKAVATKGLTSFQVVTGVVTLGEGVFAGISNLTSVTLPDGLKTIGYSAFRNCTSLQDLQLPSSLVTIGQNAFQACTSLTTIRIPESVTSISPFGVFVGCSNLASFTGKYASNDGRCLIIDKKVYAFAPAGLEEYTIPSEATSVGTMVFANCGQIKHLIYPATITAIGQVYNCNRLESIIVKATTPPSIILSAWYGTVFQLFNTTNECPIYVPAASVDAYKTAQYWSDYADRIFPIEGGIMASKYLTFTSEGTTTITLTNVGENAPVLYYSTDKTNWTQWDYSELTFTAGAPLYICGDNPDGFSRSIYSVSLKYSTFTVTGDKFGVSGDIMALIDKDSDVAKIPSQACFAHLFDGCEGLTSAPSLSATKLANFCYSYMFNGCSSLTSAPDLPATTLTVSCYSHMFSGCRSLVSAPDLPATNLANECYRWMFSDCISLARSPELPATTLEGICYSEMFSGCSSLTSAPNLPATMLASSCYAQMFYGCSSLTNAPNLPATSLADACYHGMFSGCSSLTSAPELPATTLKEYCYAGMFDGCSSLTNAPDLPATTLAKRCYSAMFRDCTGLTSAPALPATTLSDFCYNLMFYGCTSLTSAPDLPATTLAKYCYYAMFYHCTSLTSAPALPASKLEEKCYSRMFILCYNLGYVRCLATDVSAEDCLTDWLSYVAPSGTFVKSPAMNDWPAGPNGIPTGWMVRDDGVGGGNEDVGYDNLL